MKKLVLLLALFLSFAPAFAYEFQVQDRTINYNVDTLKFYENSILMSDIEVQKLFPEYEILYISDFDKNRKYEMKNSSFGTKKILLLNDTNRTFHKFFIYPESSRNEVVKGQDDIKSLITVYGKKNVRLKHEGGDEFEIVVK